MIRPKSKIAVEGLSYIGILAFLAWITAITGFNLLSFIFAVIAFFALYFFRDPERKIPQDPYAVVSPADGTVVEIETITEGTFLNQQMLKIGIFLSVFDCHINRFPVTARVQNTKYSIGKFHMANSKQASSNNEKLVILAETENKDQIVVAQIAGLAARRIVSYIAPGEMIQRGERFGMIKFGSRVDLYLPLKFQASVAIGDKVKGGETIIGWLKEA